MAFPLNERAPQQTSAVSGEVPPIEFYVSDDPLPGLFCDR